MSEDNAKKEITISEAGQLTDQKRMELWASRNQKVYRANDIVQRSRYHYTKQENSILQFMLSKIKSSDPPEQVYDVSIEELMYLLRYQTDSYTKLINTIADMNDKSFWLVPKDQSGKIKLVRWLNIFHVDPKERRIRFSFHQDIAPYLFELASRSRGRFDGYKLAYILNLNTYYSQRLYDVLISYSNNNSYYFELGTGDKNYDLYCILCADPTHNGVVPASWLKDFGHFRKKVLEPSVKDINEHTDLKVDFNLLKQDRFGNKSRKYQMVIFYLRRREAQEMVGIDKKIDEEFIEYDKAYQRKISKNQQMSIFDLQDNDKLQAVMEKDVPVEEPVPEPEVVVIPPPPKAANMDTIETEDKDIVYVEAILNRYNRTREEFSRRNHGLTEKEKAKLILAAERHIGIDVDRTYEDAWIARYIMFYLDPIVMGDSTKTHTTIFRRVLNNLENDYKSYASIMDHMFKKRENNSMRDIISGGKMNRSPSPENDPSGHLEFIRQFEKGEIVYDYENKEYVERKDKGADDILPEDNTGWKEIVNEQPNEVQGYVNYTEIDGGQFSESGDE